jgi:hypothetical protein
VSWGVHQDAGVFADLSVPGQATDADVVVVVDPMVDVPYHQLSTGLCHFCRHVLTWLRWTDGRDAAVGR